MSRPETNYRDETPAQADARRQRELNDNPGHAAARRAVETERGYHPDIAEQVLAGSLAIAAADSLQEAYDADPMDTAEIPAP